MEEVLLKNDPLAPTLSITISDTSQATNSSDNNDIHSSGYIDSAENTKTDLEYMSSRSENRILSNSNDSDKTTDKVDCSVHTLYKHGRFDDLDVLLRTTCELLLETDENGHTVFELACIRSDILALGLFSRFLSGSMYQHASIRRALMYCFERNFVPGIALLLDLNIPIEHETIEQEGIYASALWGGNHPYRRLLDYRPDATTIYSELDHTLEQCVTVASNGSGESCVELVKTYNDMNLAEMDSSVLKHMIVQNVLPTISFIQQERPEWFTKLNEHDILFLLCSQNRVDIVQLFLEAGMKFYNFAVHCQKVILFTLCREGFHEILSLQLEYGAVFPRNGWDNGWTPLHIACNYGRTQTIEILLTGNHCDLDEVTSEGYTPQYIAVGNGYENIAESLLLHGCDITATALNGDTALGISSDSSQYSITKMQLRNKAVCNSYALDGNTPLYNAARNGDQPMIQLLLQHKADPNFLTMHEDSALLAAVQNMIETHLIIDIFKPDAIDAVQMLLEYGSDACYVNMNGESSQSRASSVGILPLVRLQVHYTPKPFVNMSKLVYSPLYLACEGEHTQVVSVLLAANANPNHIEPSGVTPLFIACVNGNSDIVQCLLKYKADPNKASASFSGRCMAVVLKTQNHTILQALLAANAEITLHGQSITNNNDNNTTTTTTTVTNHNIRHNSKNSNSNNIMKVSNLVDHAC